MRLSAWLCRGFPEIIPLSVREATGTNLSISNHSAASRLESLAIGFGAIRLDFVDVVVVDVFVV